MSSQPQQTPQFQSVPKSSPGKDQLQARSFVIAWAFTVIFYFLEYAVRSSPSVMIPELQSWFRTSALGISTILGVYYYTYSSMSLVAGAALDHLGAKRTVPIGVAILGIGCLLFSSPTVLAGDIGRLLQGAGSAFAFVGAVYLSLKLSAPNFAIPGDRSSQWRAMAAWRCSWVIC